MILIIEFICILGMGAVLIALYPGFVSVKTVVDAFGMGLFIGAFCTQCIVDYIDYITKKV